jgi:RNA polymerase sigma-70 factor (ECF subfamily)
VPVAGGEHDRTVHAFLRAAAGGSLSDLIAVLDPRVVVVSDGGGRETTARRPVEGAETAARFLTHWAGRLGDGDRMEMVSVNGELGVAHFHDGLVDTVLAFTVAGGRIARVDIIRAFDKLPRRNAPEQN